MKIDWTDIENCPKCGATSDPYSESGGFERISISAKDAESHRDVLQVQCENCGTEFGTFDAETWALLTDEDYDEV